MARKPVRVSLLAQSSTLDGDGFVIECRATHPQLNALPLDYLNGAIALLLRRFIQARVENTPAIT
jgi:hypothetical protein